MPSDVEFMRRLRADFAAEAAERTQLLDSVLVEIQQTDDPSKTRALIDQVFREAHSIKGAARAVDLIEIEGLCQSIEDVFSRWKRAELEPAPSHFDLLHRAVDFIRALSVPGAAGRSSQVAALRRALADLKQDAAAGSRGEPKAGAAATSSIQAPSPAAETVRIEVRKLDAILLEAEEMLLSKLSAKRAVRAMRKLATEFERWRKAWAQIEPEVRASDAGRSRAMEMFLAEAAGASRAVEHRISSIRSAIEADERNLSRRVDQLLGDAKQLVTLPFGSIVESVPRLVRDLARSGGKDVEVVLRGQQVEVDKRVLQEIKDPLIHLVRNAIAHGVERPEARGAKPRRATLTITARQFGGGEIHISVSDDGAGIDAERVKAVAVSNGLWSEEDAARLDEERTLALLFRSEFSTSEKLTEVAGRGLGLTIVRDRVERLGGRVSVESTPGKGATFDLFVPLTLATFHGIIIAAAGQRFVLPSAAVERLVRVSKGDVSRIENRDTVTVDGAIIPLARLESMLALPAAAPRSSRGPTTSWPALILGAEDRRVAISVDGVLGEQEILAKPLLKPLVRVRHVSGATILGDGTPAVILHSADLIRSGRNGNPTVFEQPIVAPAPRKPILVVEDSITSRSLFKGILENAGYAVSTAVDGVDALSALRRQEFGLVVSDVEMPRLDGFGLTAAIRAEPRLQSLPVILITGLEKQEDRERGVGVGANAYLAKSSFQRSDLLEAVRTFI